MKKIGNDFLGVGYGFKYPLRYYDDLLYGAKGINFIEYEEVIFLF